MFEHEGKEEEKKMKLRYKVIIDTLGEVYFSEIKAPINTHEPIEHREDAESPQKVMLSERMEGNAFFMRGICKERKVIEWTLSEAFPLKYTMLNHNANADTMEIESLEIAYDQLIRIK